VKIIKSLLALLVLITVSISFADTPKNTKFLDFDTITLNNGLLVIVVPNHRAPVVYHAIFYKVGSADSPRDKTGLAHFLEHLMFKGSKKFPGNTYKKIINKLGGEQNADTTWDRTVYHVTIAKEYLPQVMELEADRMTNLNFSDEDFNKEKTVVLQERRQRTDALPEGRLMEAANASFFWQHPYGKPIIGFKNHIEQYTKQDALNFYTQWYAPNNAILVIAGDITLEEITPLLKKHYEPIKKKTLPIRQRLEEPNHGNTTAKIEIRDPQLKRVFFERIYQAPNHRSSNVQKEAALSLLAFILGDETNGRLHKALVEQQKIAISVSADYIGYFLDPYSFIITAFPVNVIDCIALEAAIEAEVKRLVTTGITAKELAVVKKEQLLLYRYNHDSLHSIADYIGETIAHNYTIEELKNLMLTIEKISIAEVNNAAKEVLDKPALVTSYSYPIITN
jgi:zinc protease